MYVLCITRCLWFMRSTREWFRVMFRTFGISKIRVLKVSTARIITSRKIVQVQENRALDFPSTTTGLAENTA